MVVRRSATASRGLVAEITPTGPSARIATHERSEVPRNSIAVQSDANEMCCHDCLAHLPTLLSCDSLALRFDRLDYSPWVRWLRICSEMPVIGIPVHLAVGKPHSTRRLV